MALRSERKNETKKETETEKSVNKQNQSAKQKKHRKRKKSQQSPEGVYSGQSEKRMTMQQSIQGENTSPVNCQRYNANTNPPIQMYGQYSQSLAQPQYYSQQQMINGPSCQTDQFPIQNMQNTMTSQAMNQAIMSRLDSIDNRLKSLDSIDQQLLNINGKISSLEVRMSENENTVKSIKNVVTDLEETKNFDSQALASLRDSQKRLERDVVSTHSLRKELQDIVEQNIRMNEELIDLKGRSMRDNLLFFNFPEQRQNKRNEPCIEKLFEFCELELGIVDARQTMKIDRAHRIGPPNSDKTRPIVAKFNFFQEKERIKRAAA